MEVEVKKCKITVSMLNQATRVPLGKVEGFKILGYVIHKDVFWIIFYDDEKKLIYKCPRISRVEMYNELVQIDDYGRCETHTFVKVYFMGNFQANKIPFKKDEEKAMRFVESMEWVKDKSDVMGQFYI